MLTLRYRKNKASGCKCQQCFLNLKSQRRRSGFRPNDFCGRRHGCQFGGGDVRLINTAIGETSKPTIRVKEDLFRRPIVRCLADSLCNLLDRLRDICSWIHTTQADFSIRQCISNHAQISSPRRCIFQHQLSDVHFSKTIDKRCVVSLDQHIFTFGPVAPANMESNSHFFRKPFDDAIEQLSRVFQFCTRITAGRQCSSHEGSPFIISTVHHLG